MSNPEYLIDDYGTWRMNPDYVRDPRPVVRPDYSYEDTLIAEVRQLEGEVATLKATLGMVRRVLGQVLVGQGNTNDLSRIIDALGDSK